MVLNRYWIDLLVWLKVLKRHFGSIIWEYPGVPFGYFDSGLASIHFLEAKCRWIFIGNFEPFKSRISSLLNIQDWLFILQIQIRFWENFGVLSSKIMKILT